MKAMDMMSLGKDQLPEAAITVDSSELPWLVETLSEKNDNIRYQAFLALQYRSRMMDDVYPFWDIFQAKLYDDNSYQRSIGMMLIAENVRWDTQDRITGTIGAFLEHLNDEKPITVRQCIQSLGIIHQYKPRLGDRIASELTAIDLMKFKETMRKSILLDTVHVLIAIRRNHNTDELDQFIMNALSGGILDSKTKKQIETML